jgi:hypothetical protein
MDETSSAQWPPPNTVVVPLVRDEVLFVSAEYHTAYYLSAPDHAQPDLSTLDDRSRAVLRALLTFSLDRLDAVERSASPREGT